MDCYRELPFIHEPRCKKCSKPIDKMEQEYCFDCSRKEFHYRYGYAVWSYDERLKNSILAFKYKNKQEYAEFYVDEIVKRYTGAIRKMKVDALIPVPIYSTKLRIRGYNQAELIARGISEKLYIPLANHVLLRSKNTTPQKGLDEKQREDNLKEAFFVDTKECNRLKLRSVLLVDDIYTTGATIEACTKELQFAGVEEVYFISLCIGKGY